MQKLEGFSVALRAAVRGIGADAAGLKSLTTAGNASSRALERATKSAAALQAQLAAVRATAAAMPAIAPHVGGGGGGGAAPRIAAAAATGGGGGGNRGRAGTGHGGNGGFHGGNVHMGPGGIGIGTVGLGAGDAFVPLALTAAGVYGGHSLYEAARDYETAATRFKTLNLGTEVNKQAEQFARGTRVMGVSSAELMETLRESVGMFGSMPDALKVAPILAQLNAANSTLFGGKIGKIDDGAVRSLMRFNDMRGLTNSTPDFLKGLDLAQRMVTGSGGALKFTDLEQMAKRGGAAFKGLSDEGVLMLSTLAQEQGGAATGTALMSLYQNLIAGRTTKKTMAALSEAGLVTLGSVTSGAVGTKKTTSTQITGVKDEKLLRENPGTWLMTVGVEAAKKMGAKTDSEVIAVVNSWISNRSASNMGANFTTQGLQAMRDANLARNAAGTSKTIALAQQGLSGKEGEFIAAWTNFKTEFGTTALPAFSNMLTNGAAILRSIGIFVQENAGLMSALSKGAGNGLSALMPMKSIRDLIFDRDPKVAENSGNEGRAQSRLAGNETAGGAFTGYRNPIRGAGASAQMVQVDSTIMLDGKAVGRAVTQHQAKEMQRPSTGARTADGRMSLKAFDIATGG